MSFAHPSVDPVFLFNIEPRISRSTSFRISRRGLTPPHRVKSISMATFTQDEIDFIKEHGNEYCRRIWLGLMNSNSPQNFDTKDEQKMKDLMSAKYELKRYYLDPSIANQNTVTQPRSQSASSVPRVPNSGTSTTLPAPVGQKPPGNTDAMNNSSNFSTDFVADFSKVPDPFYPAATTAPVGQFGQQPFAPQPFFANFDNNPVFNNSKSELADSTSLSLFVLSLRQKRNCNRRLSYNE